VPIIQLHEQCLVYQTYVDALANSNLLFNAVIAECLVCDSLFNPEKIPPYDVFCATCTGAIEKGGYATGLCCCGIRHNA